MSSSDKLALVAILIAVASVLVAGLQYLLAYIQYRRTVLPLVKVLGINATYPSTGLGPTAIRDRVLAVDLVSYGVAIWDLEVEVEVFTPATFDERGKQVDAPGRTSLALTAVHKLNPLTSGQAMSFIATKSELSKHHNLFAHVAKQIESVPERCVSIVIYCSGKRKLLKRIRSATAVWAIYCFFTQRLASRVPLRNRLSIALFRFTFSEFGGQLRRRVEQWRPGAFDLMRRRIETWIDGKDPTR